MNRRPQLVPLLLVCVLLPLAGCDMQPQGEGPGHRAQELALSPQQELELGRKAEARKILAGSVALDRVQSLLYSEPPAASIQATMPKVPAAQRLKPYTPLACSFLDTATKSLPVQFGPGGVIPAFLNNVVL